MRFGSLLSEDNKPIDKEMANINNMLGEGVIDNELYGSKEISF